MFKKSSNKKRFFYGQCGDWEGIALSGTPMEACKAMIRQSKQFFGGRKSDTEIMIVMDVKQEMESVETDNVSAFAIDSLS